MSRQHIVRLVSQKGGVGKTTIAVNLAVYLKGMGYETLLIDADTTNPSVGFHLGMERASIGYRSIAYGRSPLREAVAVHPSTGLHVIPGIINAKPFIVSDEAVRRIHSQLGKSDYRFVIFDTQPGYANFHVSKYVDETLIVTTPDMPSLSSAIRVASTLDRLRAKHSMVLNRYSGRKYEVSPREIGSIYEGRLQAVIPEDPIVPMSIEEHIPAMELGRRTGFAREIASFGRSYCDLNMSGEPEAPLREGFFRRLFRFWHR